MADMLDEVNNLVDCDAAPAVSQDQNQAKEVLRESNTD